MDAIPVASQLKSFVQVIFNDKDGARTTQENFSKQCPIVSQIRSAVEAIKGDKKAAERTQKEFGKFCLGVVEGTPIVGHALGAGYYIAGKREWGDYAMKSASRTTGVIGGGVAGFFIGGPVGSYIGGISGGLTMDGITTAVETAIHKEFVPHGILIPFNDPKNPGKWVDSACFILLDSLVGRASGKVTAKIIKPDLNLRLAVTSDEVVPTSSSAYAYKNADLAAGGLAGASMAVREAYIAVKNNKQAKEMYKHYKTKLGAHLWQNKEKYAKWVMNKTTSNEFHDLKNTNSNSKQIISESKAKKLKNICLLPSVQKFFIP